MSRFRATSNDLMSLQPHIVDSGPRMQGPPVGKLLSGEPFNFDEFSAHRDEHTQGVGVFIIGKVGYRKSTYVKCDICRKKLWMRGNRRRRRLIYDYKGEYGQEFAKFMGTVPTNFSEADITKRLKINVLDPDMLSRPHQISTFENMVRAGSERPILDLEAEALTVAMDRTLSDPGILKVPTLPRLEHWLRHPHVTDAADLGMKDVNDLYDNGHRLASFIRRTCLETLPGVFDGPTSPELRLDRDCTIYNFNGLTTQAKKIVIAASSGLIEGALAGGDPRFEVDDIYYEEAWEYMGYAGFGETARRRQKLHRNFGQNIVYVLHRFSDLDAAGATGSEASKMAMGLLADTAIKIIFHVDETEIDNVIKVCNLNANEAHQVLNFPPGMFLLKFGVWSLVVKHERASILEEAITYTNAMMHRDPKTDLLPEAA